MNDTNTQAFARKTLAVAVAAALVPTLAQASAGRVDFAYGDVKRTDTAGQTQRLRKGATINEGDTIVTARGRAQIRFNDGARASLLPNSEFRVDTYEFEEEKQEEAKSFFSLLKGGLRAITGAIGKLRRDAYKVTTPSATIGIRGTEYLAVLGNSLTVTVGNGEIEVCNNGGCTTFQNGESGYIADDNTKPIKSEEKPDASAGEVDTPQYSSSEETTGDGTPDVLGGFTNGPLYTLAVSIGDSFEGTAIDQAGTPPSPLVDATFSGNQLKSYSGPLNGNAGTASVLEAGGDGIVGWGRWASGLIVTDVYGFSVVTTLAGSESHHYAVGLPTTDMPTTGTGSYALLGGTSPTYANGSGTGTLDAASLNVDFGTRLVDAHVDFTIGGNSFSIESGFTRMGTGANAHTFAGSAFTSSSACSGGCSTNIEGFFAGAGASRAGLVYKVRDDSADMGYGVDVNGAVGFQKTGPGTPIDLGEQL